MALVCRKGTGVWHFSVYVPGAAKRLRGSTGTTDRMEAEAVERLMRAAVGHDTPRKRLLRLLDALYPPEDEGDDVPLLAIRADLARAAEVMRRRVSKKTEGDRARMIARFATWCRSAFPSVTTLRGVDRRCAQGFAAHLTRSGLSSKTVANHVGLLCAVWNQLKRVHDNLDNPWPLAMPGEVEHNRRPAFTAEEVGRIFREADRAGHGWGLACRIAASTGLRYGDIVHLDRGDVRGGVVYVTPNKTRRSSGVSVAVPLPPEVAAMVPGGTGPLFPEQLESYGRRNGFWACPFSRILEAVGIDSKTYTFHCFRHFFRTQLSKAGVSDEIAMKLGGWTQRATADRYDHDGRSAEKAQAVNAAWRLLEQGGR